LTILTNIKEDLKDFFTLREIKDKVWSEYLLSETDYVNGGVYFHRETPKYHKQSLKKSAFTVTGTNEVQCILFVNGDNVVDEQLQKRIITLNEKPFNVNYDLRNDGFSLTLNNQTTGVLKVIIPPLNTRTDMYQGVTFERRFMGQNIRMLNFNRTDDKLTFRVAISNPKKGQEVKAVTLYRTGMTNDKTVKTVTLSEGQSEVDFIINISSSDVGLMVSANPTTINEITYLGAEMELYW